MANGKKSEKWDRRVGFDRRQFSYSDHYPEHRSGNDRRDGDDRRKNQYRDIKTERRSTVSSQHILKRNLLHRLNDKGIEPNLIPGFIRNLANTFYIDPELNLQEINKRLHYLGWENLDLDYHTFQIAITCLEKEGLKSLTYKPPCWFEEVFV